jgi:hypothetical protein
MPPDNSQFNSSSKWLFRGEMQEPAEKEFKAWEQNLEVLLFFSPVNGKF